MNFKYYNANPYGNNITDCVIRSLSVLTNRTWREVYDELTDLAGDVGLLFDRVVFVENYLDDRCPRQCHYSKTVGEFAKEFPIGKYAVTMPYHITVVIDGVIYDTFDCSDRTMRCAWKIEEQ